MTATTTDERIDWWAGFAGKWAGIATILVGHALLIWWAWDSKEMICLLAAMAGWNFNKMKEQK